MADQLLRINSVNPGILAAAHHPAGGLSAHAQPHAAGDSNLVPRAVKSVMQISLRSVSRWDIVLTLLLASAALAQEEKKPVPADHPQRMREGQALFKEYVRPVLVQHCLVCHGGKTTKGKFDLSERARAAEKRHD